jgi:8-oxo-dGTP diphosphatase
MTETVVDDGTGERPALVRRLRVSAYAVCLSEGRLLLARWVSPNGRVRLWTLPGGGIEHGEDPLDAMTREVDEETGYQVEAERLLGIDSSHGPSNPDSGYVDDFHGVRIVYSARIVGGRLRDEVGGSTDRAEWFGLDAVPGLARVPLVDNALALHRDPPPTGRLDRHLRR